MSAFTLTTNVDRFTGGNGNDTFTGTYNDGATGTFGVLDVLNGGAGIDTLIINPIGIAAITPSDSYWSHISNIEKVVISTTGAGAQTIIPQGLLFKRHLQAQGLILQRHQVQGRLPLIAVALLALKNSPSPQVQGRKLLPQVQVLPPL